MKLELGDKNFNFAFNIKIHRYIFDNVIFNKFE